MVKLFANNSKDEHGFRLGTRRSCLQKSPSCMLISWAYRLTSVLTWKGYYHNKEWDGNKSL